MVSIATKNMYLGIQMVAIENRGRSFQKIGLLFGIYIVAFRARL